MNKENDFNNKILEIWNKREEFEKKYHSYLFTFLNKAYELVDLSKGLYQVEKTIRLNQISLKDYVLNSEVCVFLKENNISNYSIDDLKKYMLNYEQQYSMNISSYMLALELYEQLDVIKNIEISKIEYEINMVSNLFQDISKIKQTDKEQYPVLYNNLLEQVRVISFNNNLIDANRNHYIVQIINEIFHYYLYGNKEIGIESNNAKIQ